MSAALAIALLAAAPSSGDLPPFSFREHNAVQKYNLEALAAAGCKDNGYSVRCTFTDKIAGHFAVIGIIVTNSRLSVLTVDGIRTDLPAILSAFRARYGEPCSTGSETLQNGLGYPIPSSTMTWCFKTGKMVLHERYMRADTFSIIYKDESNPVPDVKVAPDF